LLNGVFNFIGSVTQQLLIIHFTGIGDIELNLITTLFSGFITDVLSMVKTVLGTVTA